MYIAGDEKVYMHYLVFYESLEDAYYTAYNLFKDVLEEIDQIDDFEKGPEASESITPGLKTPDNRSLRKTTSKKDKSLL